MLDIAFDCRYFTGMRGSIAFALIFTACSQYNAVGSEDLGPDGGDASTIPPVSGIPERAVVLSLASDGYVTQGTITNVVVEVRRELFDASLRITLTGLPADATATEVLIPAGATKATVAVAIPATTPQGEVNVFAQAKTEDGFTATNAIGLYVRGKAGTIDPRFANAGYYDFSSDVGSAVPVVTAVGERVVVATGDPTVEIVGFAPRAAFAPDFAAGRGIARVSLPRPSALAVAADGSVYMAGGAPLRFSRVLATGVIDTAFDASAALARLPSDFAARCGVVQPDGKILFVGVQASPAWGVTRVSASGALDTSFGGAGFFTTAGWGRDAGDLAYPAGVLVRPSGEIVVGGRVRSGDFVNLKSRDFYAATQLTSVGVLDAAFGPGGTARFFPEVERPNQSLPVRTPVLRPDGSLVLFGRTFAASGLANVVLSPAGASQLTRLPSAMEAEGSTEAADKSVIYAGTSIAGTVRSTVIRKVSSEGTPDLSFGAGGVASITRPPQSTGFGIEPLIALGPYLYVVYSWAPDVNSRERWSVVRLWN